MGLRDWSGLEVLSAALGWPVLVLVIALPRMVHVLFGSSAGGEGGLLGLGFGPVQMLLVALVALLPPIVLVAVWLVRRAR
jgi:hypothetical protein